MFCALWDKKDLTYPGDDEEANANIDSNSESEDKAADQTVCTKHSANRVGNNAKKLWGGELNKHVTWIWHVQKQDLHDIPSLNGNSTQEDVHKHEKFFSMSFDCTNIHF